MVIGFPERFSVVRENMFPNESVFPIYLTLHSLRKSEIEYPIEISVTGGTATVTEGLDLNETWDVSLGLQNESSKVLTFVHNLQSGETEITSIEVFIKDDMDSEDNETFTLRASAVDDDIRRKVKCYDDGETSEEGNYFCSHTVTIVDDDGQFQNHS